MRERARNGAKTVKRARRAAAFLLSLAVSFVVAETLLRRFAPQRTVESLAGLYPAMFEESEYLPYRLRENYRGRLATSEFDTRIHINALGYRGEDFTFDKGDRRRILVIGDSQTFGWGVEDWETYSYRLQQLLSKKFPSGHLQVINAGFAACYSPDTYYLYLKREGLALEPDLVIVGIFVGNDLDSAAAFENEWTEQDAAGLPLRIRGRTSQVVGNLLLPREIPLRYRLPVVSRSHLFQGLVQIWWNLRPKLANWQAYLPLVQVRAMAVAPDRLEEQVPPIYRLHYTDQTENVMNRVQWLLLGMKQLASEARVPLYVLLIPEQSQLLENAYSGLPADVGKPQRLLGQFFERERIKYLDLLPLLRGKAAGRPLYFPADRHWNQLGHQLAADALADFVSTEWLTSPW